jgi:8-oxo-dGTP diphosphatase
MNRHLYLFTLEVTPMRVGAVYAELPLHCTLMHRFWSDLSVEDMSSAVKPLFDTTAPITLTAHKRVKLGPKQLAVSLIEHTDKIRSLNMQLYVLLNKAGVEYTAPQFVGEKHIFHVTDRETEQVEVGNSYLCKAAYLVEVGMTEHERKRIIRAKFTLTAHTKEEQSFDAFEYWPDLESDVHFIPQDTLPTLPTTAAVIVALEHGDILLIKNTRGWDIPGGHIEPNETPVQTISRELMEEAAATVTSKKQIGYLKVTQRKGNKLNKSYPREGAIIVYVGSGIQLHNYEPQFEATERMLLPIEQLPNYHHNWTEMNHQIVLYAQRILN